MDLTEPDDPRVGSGRENSTGGTLSHLGAGESSSLSALGSTFVPVLIYSVVCLLVFFFLRPRCPRVYAPRTISGILLPEELSPSLPSGWFNWVKPFFKTSDTFLLHHGSLDGFFFLRYIKILAVICLVGCCCTWPILLPLHGTGERGLTQLDLLTIGNVSSSRALYGHVAASWTFFGFILYMISRECIYYVSLRQAYLLSPSHSQRLSSRTVMFTCVPRNLLDEAKIRKLFGDAVKNVWIPRNTGGLRKLVKEREQTAIRLEKAEIALIKTANAARAKKIGSAQAQASATGTAETHEHRSKEKSSDEVQEVRFSERSRRSSEPLSEPSSEPSLDSQAATAKDDAKVEDDADYIHPYGLDPALPDVRGSVAAQWIPVQARPYHRPLANYGRRVDTIRWTRLRLKTLNIQIAKLRRRLRTGQGKPINALFVEFDSQANAETAYQIVAHHRPLHMSPAFIGIRPDDVVWSTLRMEWWERIVRRFLVMGFITFAVIFWSIPSAFVAIISKVSFLASVPFLSWITKLPSPILGLIEGLLPAIALSLLMAAVPMMLRACARAAGVPSVPLVEVFTQNAYFVFQVVQVFLITTLTAAASTALTDILKDPISAKDLLSANIPKASNFYLSYILVQCLAGSASEIVHLVPLAQHQVMAKGVQNPRWRFKVRHRLRQKHWGSVFPVFTNLAVIAICYSCIAPLILGFAGLGMCLIYVVYRYNLMYCFESDIDTKGLLYPRALMHLIVGLYLAEICMIGLFALHEAIPQLILMVFFLIFTFLIHISINDAVSPLLFKLPRTLALHDRDLSDENDDTAAGGVDGQPAFDSTASRGAACDYYNLEEGIEEELDTAHPMDETNERAIEGASGLMSSVKEWVVNRTKSKAADVELEAEAGPLSRVLGKLNWWLTPDRNRDPNFLMRWLHPEVYEDYDVLRRIFPADVPLTEYPDDLLANRGYWPPEMWQPNPRLWIPRDDAHVSRQEVAHTGVVQPITDRGAWLDANGKIVADMDAAPFKEPRIRY